MSFLPHGSDPSTAAFTCNTCGIRFSAAEFQRQHMKTDWHKYNLKRRVAALPSISSETFAEKVLFLQQQRQDIKNTEDELGFYVHHRKRPGKSQRQLTKKELKQLAKRRLHRGDSDAVDAEDLEADIDLDHIDEIDGEETGSRLTRIVSPTTSVASEFSEFSLGDSVQYSEAESNMDTASEILYSDTTHSDWGSFRGSEDEISEEEDSDIDSDIESMVDVLPNHFCFYCGENNHDLESNVRHMSKYHGLYIPERSYLLDLDGLLTYMNEVITMDHECLTCGYIAKSSEGVRQHMRSKGHCRLPYETLDEKEAISEFYDFSNEEVLVPRVKKSKKAKTVSFADPSTEAEDERSEDDGFSDDEVHVTTVETTLVLPLGSRVGHRSMVRYHRQNLPSARDLPEASRTVALVDRRYAPGLTTGQVSKQEKEVRRLELKAKNLHERRTKATRVNYQKHFRDELLGPM